MSVEKSEKTLSNVTACELDLLFLICYVKNSEKL